MSSEMNIPFNKPYIIGDELKNIEKAVNEYGQLAGDGIFTKKCEEWLESKLGCKKALLAHSCTAALEMAAILVDVKAGDEVIMPSYTFVSTANAFVLRGAVPVFVDIRKDTLNIDESLIEAAITEKTKAIVAVHYAGVPCEMTRIKEICNKYSLFLVEDAAQALLSRYNDKYLGTIGDVSAISFHETKNVISGEGGALLVNNEKLIARSEIIREKGTNRKSFFRGEVDKYTWVDIGSSFLPGELIAAFLYEQLKKSPQINGKRVEIYNKYFEGLRALEKQGKIIRPTFLPMSQKNGHLFYILTGSLEERTDLIKHLRQNSVNSVFHYVPLHQAPAGKKYCRVSGELPVTEDISNRLLRLPLYYELSLDSVTKIVELIIEYYKQ